MTRLRMTLISVTAAAIAIVGIGLNPLAAQGATPQVAGGAADVYVVAVGDIACDPSPKSGLTPDPYYYASYNKGNGTKDGCRHKAVGAAVIAAKPDMFWPLGDNQYYDGTYSKYLESYDSAFGPLKAISYPVPGNHEWKDLTLPTNPGSGYFTYFGAASHPETGGTYSFDAGDWHVLAINDNLCDSSHPCGPGSALATWIAKDVAANPKPCTVAMWHHPLWSLGEAHKGGYAPMVPVWNQLHDLGVDMVVTGHDHNYVRTKPLGKATLNPADPNKVAVPTVDPTGMVEFVIGTGGVDNYAANAATAAEMGNALAAYQVGKPSPGLFGAGGFHLKSGSYTFGYLPAANSAPFSDNGGRTCRKATNGNPQDIPGEPVATASPTPTATPTASPTATAAGQQVVTWEPSNTTVKATSSSGGTLVPSTKATTTGKGMISYEVTAEGSTGCTVDPNKGTIRYSDPGQCEVTATAAATATSAEAFTTVVFTITPNWPSKKQDMTAVQPASGPLAGGNTITLVGHGFADTTKVLIDGTSAKYDVVSDNKVTVEVPPGQKLGPVTIRVTVGPPNGAIVAPAGYTYAEAPVATTAPAAAALVGTGEPALGNPDTGRSLASGVRLLSRTEALDAGAVQVRRQPGSSPITAPRVRVQAGQPFSLVIPGQPAAQVVNVRASFNGSRVSVGSTRAEANGSLTLPALQVDWTGAFTVALLAPSTGKRSYVRVLVVR